MDYSIIFVLAALVIAMAIVLVLLFVNKKGKKYLDVERYRVKCLAIEQQLKKEDISSYQLTVLNADKLVDSALRELGFKGNTMGERLKSAVDKFSDRNSIWIAHKLRNTIAHETDVRVTYEEARYALISFRKALKDLGAI